MMDVRKDFSVVNEIKLFDGAIDVLKIDEKNKSLVIGSGSGKIKIFDLNSIHLQKPSCFQIDTNEFCRIVDMTIIEGEIFTCFANGRLYKYFDHTYSSTF
jgi:hypothetical protein